MMTNLLKMEWYKLRTSRLFIVLLIVTFALNALLLAALPLASSALGQEMSADEMEAASGGISIGNKNCSSYHKRDIYGGKGFPNCAAGVEDGSWCLDNDACTKYMVCYWHMKECGKAWK